MERTESLARLASFEWEVDANRVTWTTEMFRLFGCEPALGIPNLQGQVHLICIRLKARRNFSMRLARPWPMAHLTPLN
jgi:hypothetical protein